MKKLILKTNTIKILNPKQIAVVHGAGCSGISTVTGETGNCTTR